MSQSLKRTERGWAGHFILADRCRFRRNTLLEYDEIQIVVSTVGLMKSLIETPAEKQEFDTVGHNRYYETMAFHATITDTRYHDADTSREVFFESPWSIDEADADDRANRMHDTVVNEIAYHLIEGNKFEEITA